MARVSRRYTALLLCCLALLISGCAFFGDQQTTAAPRPTATVQAPGTPAPPPPSGWFAALSGWRLMGGDGGALVASDARPGRVAGCALPAGESTGKPLFVLSDDAGHTWRMNPIPGASSEGQGCLILADAQQPDTFVVEANGASNSVLVTLTTDAGRTWRPIQVDSAHLIEIYGGNVQLVAGHLVAVLAPQPGTTGASAWELAEWNPDGTWHVVDATLPHAHMGAYSQPPQTYAVDPADPTHIYAVMPVGSTGMTLYGTRDDGATWHALYSWPGSTRMALWTASGDKVFAQDLIDYGTANQFFYSPDGGATWLGSGLHHRGGTGTDTVFPSATGRIVTFADQLIFNLDPATGVFSILAHDPRFTLSNYPAFTCAVVEGQQPTLLCADQSVTYGMPLPPA